MVTREQEPETNGKQAMDLLRRLVEWDDRGDCRSLGEFVDEARVLLGSHGVPASPAPFDRDRAHCLIYDLFINDDKMIRSMAAQDLKRLLGISGPVPASHLGVQPSDGGQQK